MDNTLKYKGYIGSVEFSADDRILHGQILFIRDGITYEGKSIKKINADFREAVDDYLELCENDGRKPDVPAKGKFTVKTGRALHHRAMLYAKQEDTSLDDVVSEALDFYLDCSGGRCCGGRCCGEVE